MADLQRTELSHWEIDLADRIAEWEHIVGDGDWFLRSTIDAKRKELLDSIEGKRRDARQRLVEWRHYQRVASHD
jgi:hypothetical protein